MVASPRPQAQAQKTFGSRDRVRPETFGLRDRVLLTS